MTSSVPPTSSLRRSGLCLLLVLLIGLGSLGCVRILEPRPTNTNYYLLGSDSRIDTASVDTSGLRVGLRQPRLASYLDAAHIVTRHGPNEIQFAEFHRWGEDLGQAITRVVALALEPQPGIQSAEITPWPRNATFDYVVQLRVLRFEGQGPDPESFQDPQADEDAPVPTGHSQMVVQWTVLGPEGETVQARELTRHQQDGWPVTDYSALVSRLDASLEVLAQDIGTRLRTLAQK